MMHHRIRKIRNTRRSRRFQWLNRFRRDELGVQLLEIAIVIPILLVLFAAVAEFGRYFYEYTTLAKGSRIGARYLASKSVTSSTNYQAIAKNLIVYGNTAGTGSPILDGLTTDNVSVTYAGGTSGLPETVTVSITGYEHDPLFDLGGLLNNDDFSLAIEVKPSVTMRFLLTTPSV
ncbi:MAG TPA: TadE/TadG family type IV pilus assembly protein [Pyrinomonadaceae bacterium]|nr:TadE/TadG family type IV pilus assembly protein [Pyrinomonadaceae bacterium]